MSKRHKNNNPTGTLPPNWEMRPVTKKDRWCKIRIPPNKELVGNAPFGYIVTIPYIPNKNIQLGNIVEGTIVRTKKHCGKFLLQVIPNTVSAVYFKYEVDSYTRNESFVNKRKRRKGKLYRIINVKPVRCRFR